MLNVIYSCRCTAELPAKGLVQQIVGKLEIENVQGKTVKRSCIHFKNLFLQFFCSNFNHAAKLNKLPQYVAMAVVAYMGRVSYF